MKKLLPSLFVLGAGLIILLGYNHQAALTRALTAQRRAECRQISNRIAELTAAGATLDAQIKEQRSRLEETRSVMEPDAKVLELLSNPQSRRGQSVASPELRHSLGISWDSSPDYILVSKAALQGVWLPGVDSHGVLSPTLCDILALTSSERSALEAFLQRAEAEHAAWFKDAVERVAPGGSILADYRVPANPELARRLEEQAAAALGGMLGPERLELVKKFSGVWMSAHGGMGQFGVRFTVHRDADRRPPMWYQCEEIGGSSGASDVQPGFFPDLFRAVFPGGWADVAQREGFTLPPDFASPADAEVSPQP